MTSPVVIIYGQTVQERVLRHMQIEHTIFPLWDRADGVFLVLFHEKSFSNAEPGHKIRRIGLFASHPQRLFYKPQDSPIAQMQDKINWHCHGNGTRRHTRNREVLQQEGMAIQQCDDIEVVCTNRHRHSVGWNDFSARSVTFNQYHGTWADACVLFSHSASAHIASKPYWMRFFPQLFRHYEVTRVNGNTSRMYQQTYWNGWRASSSRYSRISKS